ncbi:hypothetical protein [Mycoplasma sp. E35C]|nr:hypothetical protein [Mycoplasma sp. E35C]QZX49179.1 hypothetical protein JJE79_00160 [Mycoplasma sp. E35C]
MITIEIIQFVWLLFDAWTFGNSDQQSAIELEYSSNKSQYNPTDSKFS